jgi:uncharacterized protein (DUF1697 family)
VRETGWVALLRGINVGGRNPVPMVRLRQLFEANRSQAVSTYIQSGNVVFTHELSDRAALVRLLEAAMSESFGVSSTVVLRTFGELAEVARSQPFGPDNSKTLVTFLATKPAPEAVLSLASLDVAPDRVEVAGSDVFLHYPNGVSGARLTGGLLERTLGVPGTGRNWRTVTRLAELAEEVPPR